MAKHSFVTALVALSVTLLAKEALAAEITAYDVPAGGVGTQEYAGSLGMDFDVVRPIDVYSLGAFDSAQDGLALPITVRLYNRDTMAPLVTIAFVTGLSGTLVSGSRFVPLPCPLHLPAGFHGTIEADGYGHLEPNGNALGPARNTNDGAGAITFVGLGRYGAAGAFPLTVDMGPAARYTAGTFTFAEACTSNASCTNPLRPTCNGAGLCGAASGAFFPACTGATASCDLATATCSACNGDHGAAVSKACPGPLLPACVAGACLECSSTAACGSAAKPVCNGNTCVLCAADYAAAGADAGAGDRCPTAANPFCKADGSCGKCTTNTDCAARAGTPFCGGDGACTSKCSKDADCGGPTSEKVCNDADKLCISGCRGSGGNGCAAGRTCSSTTSAQGTCQSPVDASVDAKSDSGNIDEGIANGDPGGSDGGCTVAPSNHATGILVSLAVMIGLAIRLRRRR